MERVLFEIDFQSDIGLIRRSEIITKMVLRKKTRSLEVDVVTPSLAGLESEIHRLYGNVPMRVIREMPPLESPNSDDVLKTLKKSLILFREERFWESHVLLESVWRNSKGKTKKFLQALIILAASQVHFQMEEEEVARIQFERAKSMVRELDTSDSHGLKLPDAFVYPISIELIL